MLLYIFLIIIILLYVYRLFIASIKPYSLTQIFKKPKVLLISYTKDDITTPLKDIKRCNVFGIKHLILHKVGSEWSQESIFMILRCLSELYTITDLSLSEIPESESDVCFVPPQIAGMRELPQQRSITLSDDRNVCNLHSNIKADVVLVRDQHSLKGVPFAFIGSAEIYFNSLRKALESYQTTIQRNGK